MKKLLSRSIGLFLLIISILVFLPSCKKEENYQEAFDQFLYDLYVQEVQSDSLTLNYSLSQPGNFGIDHPEPFLGEFSIEKTREGIALTEKLIKNLKSYDRDSLRQDQQLTYTILLKYLEDALVLGQYTFYNEYLGPTTGLQAQLPILLAEYNFYEKEDINRYLELLPCVYDYFKNMGDFQKEKSKEGLFMSDAVADSIIKQCTSFIEDPEDNFLIEYFNQKINQYDGLTDEEVASYKKANKEAVINYIIPAYEELIACLEDLKGSGTNNGGLCNYPQGKEYYKSLVTLKTASDKPLDEMSKILEDAIADGLLDINILAISDPLLLDKFLDFQSFPITDPEQILADLKDKMLIDYPEPLPVSCEIKYVHESLEDFLSPAMYLVPAFDSYTDNNIYINGNTEENLSMIYTTMAHEGYPGHLYQNVYFRGQNPHPIRTLLNFVGYDEGWATYVEMHSYHLSGIDDSLAEFLSANNVVILCMYARADMAIHYEGWSKAKTIAYLENFIGNKALSETIYSTLLEEPGIYLPYAIGYLELMELREKAEDKLGDDFILKDFHKFILDIGPAQFAVIDDYLDHWIADHLEASN